MRGVVVRVALAHVKAKLGLVGNSAVTQKSGKVQFKPAERAHMSRARGAADCAMVRRARTVASTPAIVEGNR